MATPDKNKNSSSTFIRGAAILGAAAILVKVLGAFFRIPLGNIIGDKGMSYYQGAYAYYIMLLTASTAGIPTAIAKIVSERLAKGNERGAMRIVKVSNVLMLVIGAGTALLLFVFAPWITEANENYGSLMSMKALAPALFFVSVMAVYRGYFQGRQMMEPFAISQVVEQLFRVVGGLGLAIVFLQSGFEYAAAGATFGATTGAVIGFITVYYMYRKFVKTSGIDFQQGDDVHEPFWKVLGEILMIAIPITIGASVMPIMSLFDASIVIVRLKEIGFSGAEAESLYGQLSGFAQSIVNLPQVITAAVQISIVPAIANLRTRMDFKGLTHNVETGMRLAMIIGLPAAAGISLLAEPIIRLLYFNQPDVWVTTGKILAVYGWGIIFLSLYQITTGIIQGFGKPILPAIFLMAGAVFKLVLNYYLVSIPSLNVLGAAIATVTAFGVAAVLNVVYIMTREEINLNISKVFTRPVIDTVVMGLVVVASHALLSALIPGRLATVSAIMLGGFVYLIMLFVTETITDEDMDMMPGGAKLKKLGAKLRLRK
ncbi:putative polysaccharide biosynthesis protein [Acidaminobacter hydrogenoformans]|uniref:Stage V sporulation protein B n=1 Tax=Acidaminobacter hydrogenoformans DSM 2784 TaxID=1120920 RepID=A0A1G5RPT0_9FIRM|nr:polysaccharide biosynthesis protein [Acidaminobacter hydrogenoformans]SCZ76133.1 stage V sporulation protein B [Acidaminobacter hydrogenoformans DSM 2784]